METSEKQAIYAPRANLGDELPPPTLPSERAKDEEKPFLEQVGREGARKLLQAAIENEVIDYIQFHKDRRDENGQRLMVRNGHLPEREIVSGIGSIKVCQPQVRHREKGRFSSAILPKYKF